MNHIRILSPSEIQLIAAGEVVERPASIVKELVENCVDAHSSHIIVKVIDGGRETIEIEDDGKGMEEDDLKLCLLPHTTSKLEKNTENLSTVQTYGFRGEALSSIAAIANINIKTKCKENEYGLQLISELNQLQKIKKITKNNGTVITISNIFSHIPARKKFLKSRETEFNAILNTLIHLSLINYNIRFSLYHDTRLILDFSQAETFGQRALHIGYFKNQHNLIECSLENKHVAITGLTSDINCSFYDRSNIFLIINNRPIRQNKLISALLKPYNAESFTGRYPMTLLSLTIPVGEVDINVHPRKEEVALLHPKIIENSLAEAISNALEISKKKTMHTLSERAEEHKSFFIPKPPYKTEESWRTQINHEESPHEHHQATSTETEQEAIKNYPTIDESSVIHTKKTTLNNNSASSIVNTPFNKLTNYSLFPANIYSEGHNEKSDHATINDSNKIQSFEQEIIIKETSEHISKKKYCGTFAKTYLIFCDEEYITLIDQHALHERILYEQFQNNLETECHITHLITPQCLIFTPDIITTIAHNKKIFNTSGIECEQFSYNSIRITGTSKNILTIGVENAFNHILNLIEKKIITEKSAWQSIMHELHATMACKKAIKAGDVISEKEINLLIQHAEKHEHTSFCPHGRPTFQQFSKYTIDKLFKRI